MASERERRPKHRCPAWQLFCSLTSLLDGFKMPITYLPAEDHVVRYVSWSRLRKDEDDNVIGVLGAAFRLRKEEEYLSATWAEFFNGGHDERIAAAVRAVRASKLDVKTRSGFAVGKVSRIKEACLADKAKHKIRVIHERAEDNEAHTALRGWPQDNEPLLELLAEEAWGDFVLNEKIPA